MRDAAFAHKRALDLGAWEIATRASAMELNIPGIHGVGDSLIYFVDRYLDFSIYDVDFVPLAGADPKPPPLAGLHWFGVVQAIRDDRTADWLDFYQHLFGFTVLPRGQYFGVLPKGTLLESPCRKFYLQLIEPPPGADDIHWEESLLRIGFGAPDVPAATRALIERGIVFVDRGATERQRRTHPISLWRDLRTGRESPAQVNLDNFGMDTITLAGPLEAKLRAIRGAGFTQVMLNAADIVGHPEGDEAAVEAVRASGLRVTGFQVLRDFEGLSGHLHAYKVDVAKAMLQMCHALGSEVLLACSSASAHASGDAATLAKDLRKLAMLAVPFGIWIAYEALSRGRHVNEFPQAWEIVDAAGRSNLGICLDSFHILANKTDFCALRDIDARKIFLVQLSDFLWHEIRSPEDRIDTARHYRVFPGEGVHNAQLTGFVRQVDDLGYRGDYSFEVFNDDYRARPLPMVSDRARRSVKWITGLTARRSLPVRS